MIQMQRTGQASSYQIPHAPDQRQQPVQYVHTEPPHYVQYPPGPMSSYYPMYAPYQQQPNHPYPIYVMPMGPTDQSYTMSAPSDINGTVTGSLARPPLHNHVPMSHVAYKEIMAPQPTPEQATITPNSATSVGPAPTYENEYDNDLAYAQIYKSQPSAPMFPLPKFENVKKSELVPSSDSSTLMQIGTSQQ